MSPLATNSKDFWVAKQMSGSNRPKYMTSKSTVKPSNYTYNLLRADQARWGTMSVVAIHLRNLFITQTLRSMDLAKTTVGKVTKNDVLRQINESS